MSRELPIIRTLSLYGELTVELTDVSLRVSSFYPIHTKERDDDEFFEIFTLGAPMQTGTWTMTISNGVYTSSLPPKSDEIRFKQQKTTTFRLRVEDCIESIVMSGSTILEVRDCQHIAQGLKVSMCGSTQMKLCGPEIPSLVTKALTLSISGSAVFDGNKRLKTNNLELSVCGSSIVRGIHVLNCIEGAANGSSIVTDITTPPSCRRVVSQGGSSQVIFNGVRCKQRDHSGNGNHCSNQIVSGMGNIGIQQVVTNTGTVNVQGVLPADFMKNFDWVGRMNPPPPRRKTVSTARGKRPRVIEVPNDNTDQDCGSKRQTLHVHPYIPVGVKDVPCEESKNESKAEETNECKFCFANEVVLVAVPCRHAQYCLACAKKTDDKKECFTCKTKIERFKRFHKMFF